MKETEEYYAELDKDDKLPNGPGLGIKNTQVGYCPSAPELKERYKQSWRKNQEWSHTAFETLDTYHASPTGYLPPPRRPARSKLVPPASILKRPTPSGTTAMTSNWLNTEDDQDSPVAPATSNLAIAKKVVRFGVNQIREFGRSPFIGHGSESPTT